MTSIGTRKRQPGKPREGQPLPHTALHPPRKRKKRGKARGFAGVVVSSGVWEGAQKDDTIGR